MRSEKDIEAYLLRMHRQFSPIEAEPGTYLVSAGASMPPIALRVDPPLVVLRVHVGDIESDDASLFRRLLELNARGLAFTSYGLEGNRIVLASALELENIDLNELQSALDEMDLALAQQAPELLALKHRGEGPASAGR
jgi:hypothetical protein